MKGQKMRASLGAAGLAKFRAAAPEYALRGIGSRNEPQHDARTPPWQTYFRSTDPHCATGILLARRRGLTVKPRQRQEVTP